VFKPSRRALVIAASFALGLSAAGPAAHAGLLGGDDSDTAVEGIGLPVGGDLLGGDGLLGGVLGGEGLLGGGGPLGLVGGVLGGSGGGPLDLVGGVLGGSGGGPLDVVGGLLGGEDSVLAAEGLVEIVEILPLGVVPGGESVLGVLDAFSESGSIVPGLQVLDEFGVLGILGSL
jgi:hypothetical protein